MSETKTEFESTPLVVGQMPTTYGEMREKARETQQRTNPQMVVMAAAFDPALLAGAMRGLCETVLSLISEVERLTNEANNKEESK